MIRGVRRWWRGAAAAAVVSVAAACSGPSTPPRAAEPPRAETVSTGAGPAVSATKLAQLPTILTGLTAVPPGDDLLVADRRGLIWRLVRSEQDGFVVPVLEPEPVLDLSAQVSTLGERGMFSVRATPDGRSVIVNYTALDGSITVEQFPYVPGAPIDPSQGRKLVVLPHPYAWHHGGDLAFGAEGDLYVGIGDMEFRQLGIPGPQDPDLLLGGILRIPAAVIAGESPGWQPSSSDMVARGLRNPWRISVDGSTGDLWIGEVGLDTTEEIDRIPAAELGATVANFGWPYFEGSSPHEGVPPPGAEFLDPVWEWQHGDQYCGAVGGFVYRGSSIPDLQGRYVFGDLCSPEVRWLEPEADGPAVEQGLLTTLPETVVSFGQDAAGELYALGSSGGLYRLDPAGWRPGDAEQVPVVAGPATTTVPRYREECDGIVAAVLPLSEISSIPPDELPSTLAQTNEQLARLVPLLPDYLLSDGVVVRDALLALEASVGAVEGDVTAPQIQSFRDAMMSGSGPFAGFPESMARIVDAECG